MEQRHDIEELIDRYVAERMTRDERAAFEERLRHDTALAREVRTVRHIVNAIERRAEREALDELTRMGSAQELKRILNDAERHAAGTPRRKSLLRRSISCAAAAAVAAFVLIGMRPEYPSEQLYDRWYRIPAYDPAVSRGGAEIDAKTQRLLDSAAICYTSGDMARAIALYERGAETGQSYPDHARFYWAAAQAAAGRSDDAIRNFRFLARNTGSEYAEDAAWQLALEYLRRDERARAKRTLEELIANQGPHAEEARRLLDELERKKWF